MWISHRSRLMLLITVSAGLISHITSGTTIDLARQCSSNFLNFCVLTNITSSYEDPLIVSNSTLLRELHALTIRNSAVGRIPTSLLEQCPELQTFIMYNCGLHRISSNDFESVGKVRKLVIQMNRLFDLPQLAFEAMRGALEELYLAYNTIHIVHLKAFTGLTNLKYLDAQHNNIWSLQAGVFHELVNLEHIDLSHNKIDKIDAETFKENNKLNTILLSGNLFTVFEPNSLVHLTHLQQLDLSNSLLEEIRVQSVDMMFVQSSGLKRCIISEGVITLNASNNELSGVNVGKRHMVRHIDIHANHVETLDDFVGMLNLQTLDVSHNKLTTLRTSQSPQFLPLPSLVYLNVSANHLENITLDELILLSKLTTLDLSFNKLLHLEAAIFEPLAHLEKLYIEGNRLYQFDFVEIRRSHEFLQEVGLFSNHWSSQSLEPMLTYLRDHNIILPNRFENIEINSKRDMDVNQFISPITTAELQQLRGVAGIHPYWTLRDILALITLLVVLFILLLQFYRILQEEQCCQRRHNPNQDESQPLRAGQHQRLVDDNSEV